MKAPCRDDKPSGPRPLSALVSALTRPAFTRRAPASARLVADWVQIVGPALGSVTHPEKLTGAPAPRARGKDGPARADQRPAPAQAEPSVVATPPDLPTLPRKRTSPGGTLAIRAPVTVAFELQHMAPQLIERINAWAGHALVARLRFVPGPVLPPAAPPRPRRPVDPVVLREVEQLAATIASPSLRLALAAWGRAIAADPAPAPVEAEPAAASRLSRASSIGA